MNGPMSDFSPGLSMGQRSNSSNSDMLLTAPQFGVNGHGFQSDLSNMHQTMAALSMSLESLGLDMSLEEAVNRVRDLTKENAELRENVQQTNVTMKQQYQILTEWKQKWEDEREEVRQKHEQARAVVTGLRQEVEKKSAENRRLELELVQYEEKENNAAPSVKAELLSLEQTKSKLEKQCVEDQGQIAALKEEIQTLKDMRDDQCTENDKYIKIVRDKEDRIASLEQTNAVLAQEVKETQYLRESQQRLEEQVQRLTTANSQLQQQIEKLRSTDDPDLGVADMSLQSGFVHVTADDQGSDVSDSIPFTDPPAAQRSPTSQEPLKTTAVPVNSDKQAHYSQKDTPDMGETSKLQDDIRELQAEIQQKNREMEALHRKVHSTEQLLVESEHKLNVKLTQQKLESEQREEALRSQLEASQRDRHSPRTHGSTSEAGSINEEEVRMLKTQVTSLVGELQATNEKNSSLENLCHMHKQRVQNLESTLESQHHQLEVQRQRDNRLIETLRVTITKLEGQLEGDRKKWQAKETASNKLSREFATLYQQYQETAQQNEAFKKELQQRMSVNRAQETNRVYEERIDNLTAQLITAEESMHELKQENSKLKDQLQRLGGEVDMVEALRAQAEVYKVDFEAERESREKLHEEKEKLRDENNQLHLRNQQLQEELSHLSENQIAEMQRRHGQGGFTNQMRNMFGVGQRNEPGMYADGGRAEVQIPPPEGVDTHIPPREQPQAQQTQRQVPQEDPGDQQFVCPICQEQCPDMDTLQLHVIDCY